MVCLCFIFGFESLQTSIGLVSLMAVFYVVISPDVWWSLKVFRTEFSGLG
jgi:hypothetical protein